MNKANARHPVEATEWLHRVSSSQWTQARWAPGWECLPGGEEYSEGLGVSQVQREGRQSGAELRVTFAASLMRVRCRELCVVVPRSR